MHRLPSFCPYTGAPCAYSKVSSAPGVGPVPLNVFPRMRSSGKMFVVETVENFGYGFERVCDVKYFYHERLAKKEMKRRNR